MKTRKLDIAALIAAACLSQAAASAQDMDKQWGESSTKTALATSPQWEMFDEGNYAMFIHWGLYSSLGNIWNGRTYYGIGEWMMDKGMAGIPLDDYMALARNYNPSGFDADAIARLAKDAGMKYIIITSKHHEGFAMFDSKACDFNIVNTPFGRDPMKELSEACRRYGLGMGFYYSHSQDWTYPGGRKGPATDKAGNPKTFDDYFHEKCYPQVDEITSNYGDITLVWFDTPGDMPKEYCEELVKLVRRNQPGALISGRIGHDLGDYQTLGDMEVPIRNVEGLWESVDVTNDSWGYAWYDNNWKSPELIVRNLVSTVARGGTYMMNVGPDGNGVVPAQAQAALRSAGRWIKEYPDVVYGAGASPWGHALPWGDVTTKNGKLQLCVYDWPQSGRLCLPGWTPTRIRSARLLLPAENGRHKSVKLRCSQEDGWLLIDLPMNAPERFASVIELEPEAISVDQTIAVDPEAETTLSCIFGTPVQGKAYKKHWREKFGEWKTAYAVENWTDDTSVSWEFDIKEAGMYQVDLRYSGDSRMVWKVLSDEGRAIQNQQGASHIYNTKQIGWMQFDRPGRHRLTVSLLEGNKDSASLIEMHIRHVNI